SEELSITLNDATVVTDVDEVHELVEKPAEFTGDKDGVEAFLKKNIAYPADALSEQLEGTVYVKFVIDTDGSISDIEIVSSTDPVFEQEAIRLIDLTSKMWDAARQSGKKVKSKMILEIVFELTG
ncbi:MAG: energy transducer TonB, partial [Bacteroidales bacterium]|nr:energy transducer TonB [Bacteroidales bacterium]